MKRDSIKLSHVPFIEGLAIKDILDYTTGKENLVKHLPDRDNQWTHVDRKWLCDVIYTLDTDSFQALIDAKVKEKSAKKEVKRSSEVEIKAEFAAALSKCLTFSCKSVCSLFHFS